MLKDAALLTLELAETMCDMGNDLQDATPYNVLFDSGRPVFVDFGSFVPSGGDYLWAPYQQFCNFFLFPLYGYSAGRGEIARRLLYDTVEGVSAEDVSALLSTTEKLATPGYLSRVFLPEAMTRMVRRFRDRQEMSSMSRRLSGRVDLSRARGGFLKKLRRHTESLRPSSSESHWVEYYDQTEAAVLEKKKRAVSRVLEDLSPSTVLDIGCNVGTFSLMAAENGARVVSVDTDHDSVDRLYRSVSEQGRNVLPLIFNVLSPPPALGWRNRELPPATERLRSDLVIALALLHHMVFQGGQDFERCVQSLGDFQRRWLLIEYVDREDIMAKLLPRRPNVDYDWYTRQNFLRVLQSSYPRVEIVEELSATRTLILASREKVSP
jgi:SAM-dependent methyltransferase